MTIKNLRVGGLVVLVVVDSVAVNIRKSLNFLPPLNLRSWELYHPLFPSF